jgi:hypothetical protein
MPSISVLLPQFIPVLELVIPLRVLEAFTSYCVSSLGFSSLDDKWVFGDASGFVG